MKVTSTTEEPRKEEDLAEVSAPASTKNERDQPSTAIQSNDAPKPTPSGPSPRRKSLETPGHRVIPPRDPIAPSNPKRPPQIEVPPTPPTPDVPLRSESRSPTRPSAQHFSYPSRVPPGQTQDEYQAVPAPLRIGQRSEHNLHGQSTISNLKMAAAGIHGAGEALRGTVNSVMDRRLGADQETMKKNEEAIQAGRYEIENRRFLHGKQSDDPQAPPSQSNVGQVPDLYVPVGTHPAAQQEYRNNSNTGESFSNRVAKSRLGDRLGNFTKVWGGERSDDTGREDVHEPQAAPVRRPAKLQKRSSSMLSVVGE